MGGFGSTQRRVRFRRLIERLEHAFSLLAIQPDDRLAFENLLRLAVSCLNDEVIERRSFEIGGGLDRLPHTRRDASDQTRVLSGGGWHGAKLAPGLQRGNNAE